MKKVTLFLFFMLSALVSQAEPSDGTGFLQSLQGTYIELFSAQTCLSPEYASLWHTEAAKYVGEDNADAAVKRLTASCQGTLIGEKAISAYTTPDKFRFCCSFKQNVAKITFNGNHISGVDKHGQEIFAHQYHFVGKDSDGNYIYESDDSNDDEFRFFWMRPDSPSETFHIEFRYGSDKQQLTQLMTGKYAFWMASGVREYKTEEHKNSIILFVGENLGEKK